MKKEPLKPAYGRQAPGRTIKSISIDVETAEWLTQKAASAGVSASAFVDQLLARLRAEKPSTP